MRRAPRPLALAFAVCSALLAPAPALAAWTSPQAVSPADREAADHRVAADRERAHLLTTLELGTPFRQVEARDAGLDGRFGAPTILSGAAGGEVRALAASAGDRVVALWQEPFATGSAQRLFANVRDGADGAWGAAEEVPTAGAPAGLASAAVTPDGSIVAGVATHGSTGGPPDRIVATVRRAGGWEEPVVLSSPGASAWSVDVAGDAAGRVTVAWLELGAPTRVFAASWTAAGGFTPPVALSPPGESASSPRVAAGGDGHALVAWLADAPGGRRRLRTAVRRPGEDFGVPRSASAAGAGGYAVAVDPTGRALAVYRMASGGATHVRATLSLRGERWRASERLSGAGRAPLPPQVGFDAGGRAVAVWIRTPPGGEPRVEAARRPRGRRFRAPERVSRPSPVRAPRLAAPPFGRPVAVWRRSGERDRLVASARR